MADLDPLIRYRKHGVDERRRALARLYEELDTLTHSKEVQEQQLEEETELAKEQGTVEALKALDLFRKASKSRIAALAEAIEKMEVRIAAAQEDMREAFSDMKKVEITQRERKKREVKEFNKKESRELDDIGIEQHRRHEEGE